MKSKKPSKSSKSRALQIAPTSEDAGLDKCYDILKRMGAFLLVLVALDRKADFCISQDDLHEVFYTLHEWNQEVLEEVQKELGYESRVA